MKLFMRTAAVAAIAVAASLGLAASASAGTLLNQSFHGLIQIQGSDDNGSYSIDVLNGTVNVGGGYDQDFSVFKQLTEGGFATGSNQINGDVHVVIGDNTIAVTMNGQVQPFELTSTFTGITGPITNVADSATGLLSGVNLDLSHGFTDTSVTFATFYLGFQPGTHVTQTETLTFGAPGTGGGGGVPEPAAWALMLAGFGVAGAGLRSRRRVAAA